jgi:hypothetical protein
MMRHGDPLPGLWTKEITLGGPKSAPRILQSLIDKNAWRMPRQHGLAPIRLAWIRTGDQPATINSGHAAAAPAGVIIP